MPLTSVTLSQSPLGLLWHPSGYSHTSIDNIPLLVELHNSKSKHKDVSRQSRYYLSFLQDNHSVAYLVVEPVSYSGHYENVIIISGLISVCDRSDISHRFHSFGFQFYNN
jgi:hypothetical protein